MRYVLIGVAVGFCLAGAAAARVRKDQRTDERSRILLLKPGDTLSACQSFFWRDSPRISRSWMRVGSCRTCDDIADREVTGTRSDRIRVPADGRPIYFALYSFTRGMWTAEERLFRAPNSGAANACEATPPTSFGVYHWSGAATRSMSQGVEAIGGLGGHSARVYLSPRYLRDYNIMDDCYSDFTLAKAMQEPDVRLALSNPRIDTFMITAYDGTSFGDCWTQRFLSETFYTAEDREALIQEYEDFAYELMRTYAGSGKRFILSNWESDNAVYCGEAHRYVHDEAFRSTCDQNYSRYYGGNRNPSDTLMALREWFSARWAGIERGRRRAHDDGFYGVSVYSAPEINIVRALANSGLPSVLYDVVPDVPFDYVSYSAWESINRADVAAELKSDLDTIREVAGTATVIIGELGFASTLWGEESIPRLEEALTAAESWGVPYVFHWVLYDEDSSHEGGHGLFDANGRISPIGHFYRSRLSGGATAVPGH